MGSIKVKPVFDRATILATVSDWLDKKQALKIFKIVNSNDGLTCVEDKHDRLKIIFPDIHLSLEDNSIVFGLILDRNKGWIICGFKISVNNPSRSMLCTIIKEVGYDCPTNLATELYRAFKDSGNIDSPRQMSSLIKVLMMSTQSLNQ